MSRFVHRYGLYFACGAVVVAALVAVAVHVAREPAPPLSAHATATLTIGNPSSPEGTRLVAPFGDLTAPHFALVRLSWTSKGNACALDAVMHPDQGWKLTSVTGDGQQTITGHVWSNIVANNPDAELMATQDTPVALSRSAGTLTMLYALDATAVSRAPAARMWLIDRCTKTKPVLVPMPHTVLGATFPP